MLVKSAHYSIGFSGGPMKNIFGLIAIMVALGPCGALADAQQAKKVSRLGYLASADPARESARAEAIRLALRERGYIEGQNIAIEYRYAEGKLDRAPEFLALFCLLTTMLLTTAPAANAQQTGKVFRIGRQTG
jgi:hypothetical protein